MASATAFVNGSSAAITTGVGGGGGGITVQLLITDFTPLMPAISFSHMALQASSFTIPLMVATPSFTSATAPAISGVALIFASMAALISASLGLQLINPTVAEITTANSTLESFILQIFLMNDKLKDVNIC